MSTHARNSVVLGCVVGFLSLVLVGGCPASWQAPAPPAELAAVIADREKLSVTDADIAAAQAGAIVDDLALLDGCFAHYRRLTATESDVAETPAILGLSAGAALADEYRLWQFDAAAHTLTTYAYSSNLLLGFDWGAVSIEHGTYATADGNRLIFTMTSQTFSHPVTGELLTMPDDVDRFLDLSQQNNASERAELRATIIDLYTAGIQYEYFVTLDGDRLRLTYTWVAEDTGQTELGENDVLLRTTCP